MQPREPVAVSDRWNTQLLYFTCSSLSEDDHLLFEISDCGGSPNIWVRNLVTGHVRQLSDNHAGYMRSYVYFDGEEGKGLAKASVTLDAAHGIVYYIQDNRIYSCSSGGKPHCLTPVPHGEWTAFCHVSHDGKYLCVPTCDHRVLDFDPEKEGSGLDKRPVYDIDGRVQSEHLSSYLCIYDTATGMLVGRQQVPDAWITHVQFCPTDNHKIMFNNEWPSVDCGIRRIWLSDWKRFWPLRKEGNGRSREDWVCHEMFAKKGNHLIYHGAYKNGPAFVGRIRLEDGLCQEIPLPKEYDVYGHFNVSDQGLLVCDGYYKMAGETLAVRNNSTDNGPDPHKKQARYICTVTPDWERKTLAWKPLCAHDTDWLGQDSHPHPIFDHRDCCIYFSSRPDKTIGIWRVRVE